MREARKSVPLEVAKWTYAVASVLLVVLLSLQIAREWRHLRHRGSWDDDV